VTARRRTGDGWAELALELGERMGAVVREVIPPEAQLHLLNAQRELLAAIVIMYEHQAAGRGGLPGRRRRSPAAMGGPNRRRAGRIPIE
jgi:hypothetical protein